MRNTKEGEESIEFAARRRDDDSDIAGDGVLDGGDVDGRSGCTS